MVHDRDEQARLIRQASKQAISLAMEGRWREAVEANKGILENFANDVDTLNRLGRAYMELGEYDEARSAYSRAKTLDPYNSIASKNLRRLAHLEGEANATKEDGGHRVEPQYFIEETGKAGVVKLYHLAAKEVMARAVAGDAVELEVNEANLVVTNASGEVLGWVEPRHGQRLARLMAGGNKYIATVISSSEDALAIMIREVYQHPGQAGQLSFPSKGLESLKPFVSDKLIRRHLEYEEGPGEEAGYGLIGEEEEAGPEEVVGETEEEEE